MSLTRKLIIAFWVCVAIMLLWQFYTYNEGLRQAALDHPQQTSFWYTNAVAKPSAPISMAHRDGADIEQTAFLVLEDTPSRGNITCQVTLKNVGNTKASEIQINVRPYRGTSNFDEEGGAQKIIVLSDDDPISRDGQWIDFPDLKAGESSTQSVVFMAQDGYKPGKNPKPDIVFKSDKAKP